MLPDLESSVRRTASTVSKASVREIWFSLVCLFSDQNLFPACPRRADCEQLQTQGAKRFLKFCRRAHEDARVWGHEPCFVT